MKKASEMTVAESQDESVRCESSMGEAETILADLRVRLGEIREEIARRMKPAAEPRVSDHALMRYAERILGIDMEELRAQILTEATKSALRMGATGVTVNGVKMIAKDGTIITVLAEGMRPKKKTKRGWIEVEDELDGEAA